MRRSSVAGDPQLQLHLAPECHDCVTILFSDIVGFSSWAHRIAPKAIMDTLNDLFTRLDDIILSEMPSLYKVGQVLLCHLKIYIAVSVSTYEWCGSAG